MFTAAIAAIKFVAWKTFIIGVLYIGIPILIYNILVGLIFDFLDYGMDYIASAEFNNVIIQFSGMGGWMAQTIMLPQAFSIFMSFLAIRFIMRFIPFLK